MKTWYLVQTKARQETVAEANLLRQEFTVFLPLISRAKRKQGKWQDINEPLFPGYLFIQVDLQQQNTAPVRSTVGVLKIVRFGTEPQVVPDEVIQEICKRMQLQQQEKPALPFTPGQAVAVTEGCFRGVEAIFLAEQGTDRVQLLLDMLGRNNPVTLQRNQVSSKE